MIEIGLEFWETCNSFLMIVISDVGANPTGSTVYFKQTNILFYKIYIRMEKLVFLNKELDNLINILYFFNKNFNKFQAFSAENNKLYFYYLTERYNKFLNEKEKILKEVKNDWANKKS